MYSPTACSLYECILCICICIVFVHCVLTLPVSGLIFMSIKCSVLFCSGCLKSTALQVEFPILLMITHTEPFLSNDSVKTIMFATQAASYSRSKKDEDLAPV